MNGRQGNNPRRRNNNATRSRKGARQDRNAGITTQNERILVRKFILNEKVALDNSQGNNTTLERTFQWDGAELQGFNAISAGFDQYRIRRIQVFVTPSTNTITQLQIPQSLAQQPIFACASTTIYSAVDVTGSPNPGVDIQAFQNCEFRTPNPFSATKIADFQPRLSNSDALLFTPNTWISTSNTSKLWDGLHTRFVNSNGTYVFPSPTDQQEFNVRSVVHVEFRHPIYDTVTLMARLQEGRSATVPAVPARESVVNTDENGDI